MAHHHITRRGLLGRMATLVLSVPLLHLDLFGKERPVPLQKVEPAVKGMLKAATAFLDALSPALREKALIPFDGEERTNWHFVPTRLAGLPEELLKLYHERKGVNLKEMSGPQREAAHALLRSALSSQGYLKATSIAFMEEILREAQIASGQDAKVATLARDPELYFVTIFGDPSREKPWGWRFEGHHLSLHFTSVTGELVATTPMFLGSNPATVRHGSHAGLNLLAAEAGIARELLRSFNAQQSGKAIINATAPADIITGNSRKASLEKMEGLAASTMNGVQRSLLVRLIQEYVTNLRPELAESELNRVLKSGMETLHFAWAGGVEVGQPHYYRIHSPKLLIEYDNTQNDANHIHTVYRDPANDFGEDMLARHYKHGGH